MLLFAKRSACLFLLCLTQAQAADLGTIEGFNVRLDTSIRLSLGLRTDGQDQALLQNANTDDGDLAFGKGVNSERADVTSVLDATRGDLGFEVSVDGWYDAIYHQTDADRSAGTFNPIGIPADRFPADTRRLLGGEIELGTAFARDRFEVAGVPVTLRIGRQSLLWGESLFFPQDGIAAGQAPVDVIKALSQPLAENQQVYLPVTQVFGRATLGGGVSLQGYEQLEWRRDRTPGVASFFSSTDIEDVGGQRVFLPGGTSLFRDADSTPGGFGQFGAALRYASDVVDLGLYALRYDSKDGFAQAQGAGYHLVFPRGIETLGVSASTYAGDGTLAGEVSVRRHMPLVSTGFAGVSDSIGPSAPQAVTGLHGQGSSCGTGQACPTSSGPTSSGPAGYATGQALLALASYQRQLPTGRLWQGATLDAELSTTDLLGVERDGADRLARTTRFSSAAEAVFTPAVFRGPAAARPDGSGGGAMGPVRPLQRRSRRGGAGRQRHRERFGDLPVGLAVRHVVHPFPGPGHAAAAR